MIGPEILSRPLSAIQALSSKAAEAWRTVRSRPRSFASTGVVALAAIGLLVAMFLSDGFRARTYDLEDAYVWATSEKEASLLRYNMQTDEVDWKGAPGKEGAPEVIQDGTDVFAVESGRWHRVEVAKQTFEPMSGFGDESDAMLGGGTLAVMDRDGGLWVVPVDRAADLSIDGAEPSDGGDTGSTGEDTGSSNEDDKSSGEDDKSSGEGDKGKAEAPEDADDLAKATLAAGEGAAFAVGRSGEVAVLTGDGSRLVVFTGDKDREPEEIEITGDVKPDDAAEVTLVGARPVALVGTTLILPDGSLRELDARSARLQWPGDTADDVVVATESDLLAVPLDGGEPKSLTEDVAFGAPGGKGAEPDGGTGAFGDSAPQRPVAVGGQTAAVWTGAGARVYWSAGGSTLAEMRSGFAQADMRFRVNRNNVILNNKTDGVVYALVDGELRDTKWQDTQPTTTQKPDDKEETENPISFDPASNRPPKANPDQFGARPGLPSIVHPLDNDEDPDSDVLTIELDAESVKASGAIVDLVEGGQGLQVTPGDKATTVTFTYRAYDGNPTREEGLSNPAEVTVTVFGADVNNAPKLKNLRKPRMEVGAKSSAQYQVLQDYEDPEGDPIYLEGATPGNRRNTVAARSDGRLTYTDTTGEAGETYVSLVVADAPMLANVVPKKTEGERLPVVVSAGDLDPVARNDYVTTLVNTPVVIQPLANDDDPNGDPLGFKLVGLEHLDPAAVKVTRHSDNTVTVTPSKPGSVSFGYELTTGTKPVKARIRVDVVGDEARAKPSAGLDLVVLPRPTEGRTAERTVDLLANDYSPQGDVLVVTGIAGLDESNIAGQTLTAQLLELRRLRVTSKAPPTTPVQFKYILSDGTNTVDGTVVVVSSPSDENQPPVTANDVVTVRSGDVVSVPVLANDLDPEGARLYLGSKVKALDTSSGTAWATATRVRFVAPSVPLKQTVTVDLEYMAYDGPGPDFTKAKGSPGRLRVRVANPGADSNSPPRPQPVEARVLAGKQVKITVPTAGVDPDGDSVMLVGIGFRNGEPDAPRKGRVVGDPGVDSFVYEAFEGQSGTDTFSYTVIDSAGAVAYGKVRVGVAKAGENQKPVAVRDSYEVSPGAPLLVDPLANDIDSDGDPIDFIKTDPFIGHKGELAPEVVEANGTNRVRFQVPGADDKTYAVPYRITDPVGLTSDSTIEVFATSKAVGHPPIARDDRAKVEDPKATSVNVPVLANDSDPDGNPAELELSVVGSNATVGAVPDENGLAQLEVTLTDRPQIVLYSITDPQDLTGYAVVRVPAAGEKVNLAPQWKPAGPCAGDVKTLGGTTEKGIVFDGADSPVDIKLKDCGFTDPEGAEVRFVKDASVSPGVTGKLTASVKDAATFTLRDSQGGRSPYQEVVTLVVTDAPQGKQGEEVLVQIPVGVVAETDKAVNQPPKWKRTTSIEVTQDGEPSLPVDLAQLVDDPEGDELRFTVTPPKGITLDGDPAEGTLRLKGNLKLPLGENAAQVTVAVTDGEKGEGRPVEATFAVSGIKTNKAMPTLRPVASVDDATKGEKSTVDVLEGSTDPVGEGLKVIRVEAGSNPGKAVAEGKGSVSFTPAQVGPATVSFVVSDHLDRQVAGKVTYKVAASPGPPTTPQVLDFTYDSVSLRWGQAEDNASEIEKYVVKVSPGGMTASCGTELSCTVDGLTPGTAYTFVVTAFNGKGEGEPSPASAPATPDECPKAPTNVNLEFDATTNPKEGGQLVATWATPQNNGTAITGYEIVVDPGGQVLNPAPTATQQVITGLTNGADHNIKIRAKNGCEGGWGDEALAGPAIPAGVPDAPANPQALRIRDKVGGKIDVSWTAPSKAGTPSDNGDQVAGYTITEVAGKTAPVTIEASEAAPVGDGTVKYQLSVDEKVAGYSFKITATNKAGEGTASAATTAVNASGVPDAVRNLASTPSASDGRTGLDSALKVSFNPPQSTHGPYPVSGYQYRIDGGQPKTLASDNVIRYLTNGKQHTVEIRAVTNDEQGEWAAVGPNDSTNPYGPVHAPNVGVSNPDPRHVRFSWWPPSPSNTGRPISVTWSVNGSGFSGTGESGDTVQGNGYGQTFTVTVSRCDSMGQCAQRSATGATVSVAGTVTVDDAFLDGTWTRNATHGGAWVGPPTGAVAWHGNGTKLDYVCSLTGGTYTVKYKNAPDETWSWWLRLTDDTYVRIAAVTPGTNAQMGPHC